MSPSSTEAFPIEIDEKVVEQVRRVLARKGKEDSFLRLGVKGGGCSGLEYIIAFDQERKPIDISHTVDGVEFVCDAKSARFLAGARLVATGNLLHPYAFENPNAQRSCGCGTSFTPKG